MLMAHVERKESAVWEACNAVVLLSAQSISEQDLISKCTRYVQDRRIKKLFMHQVNCKFFSSFPVDNVKS